MNLQADPGELLERIRREARRHQQDVPSPAAPASYGDAESSPLPAAPVFAMPPPGGFSCESLLAQTASMVERARGKTTVRKSVPKILRAFWRNQGGYNDIMLEALERLRKANGLLAAENIQLRGHVHRQTEWMEAAGRVIAGLESRIDALERQTPDPQE